MFISLSKEIPSSAWSYIFCRCNRREFRIFNREWPTSTATVHLSSSWRKGRNRQHHRLLCAQLSAPTATLMCLKSTTQRVHRKMMPSSALPGFCDSKCYDRWCWAAAVLPEVAEGNALTLPERTCLPPLISVEANLISTTIQAEPLVWAGMQVAQGFQQQESLAQ